MTETEQYVLSAGVSLQAHDRQRSDETQAPARRTQTQVPWQDAVCAAHCYKHKQSTLQGLHALSTDAIHRSTQRTQMYA